MFVTSLVLNNIRIIEHCDLRFNEGITAFVGDNGQGKTTLLESIYWSSYCKSFRHVSNDDVIAKNSDSADIELKLTDGERPQDIVAKLNRNIRDSVLVNGQKLKRIKDLQGTLRVSIFTPDDLEIIKGSSSYRRELIDDTLISISKKYAAAYSDYNRILKQKNALLKEDYIDSSLLSVLNDSLCIAGGNILSYRLNIMNKLREKLVFSYHHISG